MVKASKTNQSKETKSVKAKYKKLILEAPDTKAAMALVNEAAATTTDPIQRSKIIHTLVNYVK